MVRTDLAQESAAYVEERSGSLEGVDQHQSSLYGCPTTEITIKSEPAARMLGKPQGSYITVDLTPLVHQEIDALRTCAQAVGESLRSQLPQCENPSVLVAGLGNRTITPDAIGPWAVENILVTRHLSGQRGCEGLRPVSAVAAGVLGTTGVETMELLQGVVDKVRPGLVIAVDALAARCVERLCATVQLADTGIVPGSGVGNARKALNRETLGVPVIAVGVPTVVDGATLTEELTGQPPTEEDRARALIVTPRDIDRRAMETAQIVGMGINLALQELEWESLKALMA